MSYEVIATHRFLRDSKKLSKRYASLKQDLAALIDSLQNNPLQGISLGDNCYKIRLSITSKGKGKSGGARVITHIIVTQETVLLLTIYDKTDKESISDKELRELLNQLSE